MTPAEFKTLVPVFKDVPVPQVQAQIDASEDSFDEARWGSALDFYRAQWVAHMLVVNGADGAPTLAVEANDVVTKATEHITTTRSESSIMQQQNDDFMRTTWGQRYVMKARQIGMGGAGV